MSIPSVLHGDSLDVWWANGLKPGSAPIVLGSDYTHGFRVMAASYSGVSGIDRYPAKTAFNLGNASLTTSLTTTIDGGWHYSETLSAASATMVELPALFRYWSPAATTEP